MMQVENFTVFYRPLRGHSVDHQRKLVAKMLPRLGGRIVAEYVAGETGDDRDEWIKRTRPNEGAIVAGLFVIPEPMAPGKRPSADYAAAIMSLVQRVALVVDAESGLTSRDGEKWREMVERHALKTAAGRQLSPARAKRMAQRKWDRAEPGVYERWQSPQMAKELERWQQHWRDPKFHSADAAFAALPKEIQEEIGSITTARRIFGRRRPGDPTAGGRPTREKTAAQKKRDHVVYFVQYGKTRQVKIGTTRHVTRRVCGLRSGSPTGLHLLATVPGDEITEAEMHRRFRKYRLRGEWFRMEGALAKFIDALMKKQSKK